MKYKNIKSMMIAIAGLLSLSACTGDQAMPPINLPEEMGDQEIGNGTWNHPMAAYLIGLGNVPRDEEGEKMTEGWVSGYIVGWINTAISTSDVNLAGVFSIPEDPSIIINSNLMIASRPDETNPENVATVQLPSGDVRNALNLKDNPKNLGELVTIYGELGRNYCGKGGVRSVSAFRWGSEGIEPDPLLIKEFNLKKDTQNFKFEQTLPASGLDVWTHSTSYGIVAKGYNGTSNVESEALAISPAVNLAGRKTAAVNIHQAANYFGGVSGFEQMCTIMVREEGSDEWETLTVPNQPNGSSWTFVDSGDIDLSAYLGKKVEFGFRYTSTVSLTGTWEIDRVTVTGEKTEN